MKYGIWKVHRTRDGESRGWWRRHGARVEFDSMDDARAAAALLRLPAAVRRRHDVTWTAMPLEDDVLLLSESPQPVGDGWSVDDDTDDLESVEREIAREDAWYDEEGRRKDR